MIYVKSCLRRINHFLFSAQLVKYIGKDLTVVAAAAAVHSFSLSFQKSPSSLFFRPPTIKWVAVCYAILLLTGHTWTRGEQTVENPLLPYIACVHPLCSGDVRKTIRKVYQTAS